MTTVSKRQQSKTSNAVAMNPISKQVSDSAGKNEVVEEVLRFVETQDGDEDGDENGDDGPPPVSCCQY